MTRFKKISYLVHPDTILTLIDLVHFIRVGIRYYSCEDNIAANFEALIDKFQNVLQKSLTDSPSESQIANLRTHLETGAKSRELCIQYMCKYLLLFLTSTPQTTNTFKGTGSSNQGSGTARARSDTRNQELMNELRTNALFIKQREQHLAKDDQAGGNTDYDFTDPRTFEDVTLDLEEILQEKSKEEPYVLSAIRESLIKIIKVLSIFIKPKDVTGPEWRCFLEDNHKLVVQTIISAMGGGYSATTEDHLNELNESLVRIQENIQQIVDNIDNILNTASTQSKNNFAKLYSDALDQIYHFSKAYAHYLFLSKLEEVSDVKALPWPKHFKCNELLPNNFIRSFMPITTLANKWLHLGHRHFRGILCNAEIGALISNEIQRPRSG